MRVLQMVLGLDLRMGATSLDLVDHGLVVVQVAVDLIEVRRVVGVCCWASI